MANIRAVKTISLFFLEDNFARQVSCSGVKVEGDSAILNADAKRKNSISSSTRSTLRISASMPGWNWS